MYHPTCNKVKKPPPPATRYHFYPVGNYMRNTCVRLRHSFSSYSCVLLWVGQAFHRFETSFGLISHIWYRPCQKKPWKYQHAGGNLDLAPSSCWSVRVPVGRPQSSSRWVHLPKYNYQYPCFSLDLVWLHVLLWLTKEIQYCSIFIIEITNGYPQQIIITMPVHLNFRMIDRI